MSKIGILTYHRAYNYGAILQAYALASILRNEGHEAYFIDYWPDYHRRMYALFSLKRLKHLGMKAKVFYVWNSLFHYFSRKKLYAKIQKNVDDLILPYTSQDSLFDVIVYGSDQIWRKQPFINAYNPIYFGNNNYKAPKHVAYAASMGKMPSNVQDRATIKNLVKHLNEISVRENELHCLLSEMNVESQVVLDPTLLLSSVMWKSLIPLHDYDGPKYALFFEIIRKSFDLGNVKDCTRSQNLELKIFYNDVRRIDFKIPTITGDLIDFLSYIKHAEIVFTSSFHALVFSILFHKQFFACFRANEGRAKSLLMALGLEDRLLKYGSPIPKVIEPINYNEVERKLELLRRNSKEILLKMVNTNEN